MISLLAFRQRQRQSRKSAAANASNRRISRVPVCTKASVFPVSASAAAAAVRARIGEVGQRSDTIFGESTTNSRVSTKT
jgi:hypothetical protein